MKSILTPYLLLSLLAVTLQSFAQDGEYHYDHDSTDYEYDHTYEYNHEYHYEWGMWGYRHEAKMIDSLSVLEMMDSLSRQEVAYQWEDFQEKKQKARKEKKEKKKKEKKDKKDKKEKGERKTEKGKKGGKGEGMKGRKGGRGIGYEGGQGRTEKGEWRTENGKDFGMLRAPSEASLTAGVGYVAPLRGMNQVPDAQERSALMAIYNQMNGKNWVYQDNWGSSEPLENWAGITVENGDVVALELRRNGLTGGIPLTINRLSALEYLNLGGNAVTSLPQQIGELSKLKALYFDECQLANLPPGLGNLSELKTLYLNYNRLTSLPSTIDKLDALEAFYLYGNPLIALPKEIGGLSSLMNLFLFQSSVTSLPEEIGQLKALRGLFPRETELTELPKTINNLSNLRYLNAADSKLKSLPVMDKLSNLKGVIVTGNQLEQIPNWKNHPNIANLFWRVDNNLVDLNQIAQNLTGVDTHPFVDFTYRPQESPTLVLPVAGTLLDPFPVKHPESSYQWQREVSGSWQNIAGATGPTYTAEQGSLYRCRLVNAWLPGMIYYSHPLQPDATGATMQWIEAECASIGSNWQVKEDAQASEGQYVVYPQGEGVYRTSPSSDPSDHLVYTVTVEQAQNYFLLARINAPSYGDDSFWVKIDNNDWITWSGGIKVSQGFQWNQLPGGAVFLSKGTHTIVFTYREDGARLDKLSLSLSNTLPSGQGEAALACESTGVAASLWVEAECAQVGSNWQQAESSSASDGKYMVYPNGNYVTAPPNSAADHLVYTLTVEQTQNYFLMARVNAPSYQDDSYWVRIDDSEWFTWASGIKVNQGFQWNQVPGKALELTAGTHTITFAPREDGTQLDKLVLRLSADLPSGLGEAVGECQLTEPYTPPAPPTVNNPPDNTTAPGVTGNFTPASNSNSSGTPPDINYVRVYAPRTEISNASSITMSSPVANVAVTTEYSDGQGRTVQSVARGAGGSASQDMVQPVTYDALGRAERQYLPYATTSNTSTYQSNAVVNQYDFYTSGPGNVARSDYPYAQTRFEASPLSRVVEQGAPGKTFQPGNGHTVGQSYRSNTSGDAVRRWTVSADAPSTPATYGAGSLYVTVVTDENGHRVSEFTNRSGQTVLKRVQGPNGNMDTYYVYDVYDQLRFTIPPEASKLLKGNYSQVASADFRTRWLFGYDYDEWGNMRAEHTPGGGTTRMIYDAWDRPVLSQTATMRQQNAQQWAYTKYDYLDRAVVSGLYTTASTEADLRSSARSTTTRFTTTTSSGVGYNLSQGFPSVSEATVRQVSYYDNYNFPHASAYGAGGVSYRTKVKGLMTGSMSRKLDDNTWLKDVTYYDEQYRPVVIKSDNHRGGTDQISTTYRNTITDEVVSSTLSHNGPAKHTVKQTFTYDHMGRLQRETHQLDGGEVMTLATHAYNALGQRVQKQMNLSGSTAQQSVDYRYHIRGWLTRINDLGDASDFFAQELYYDYGFDKKQYNGNLSGVRWSRAGGQVQAYGYLYDEADRLTGADFRSKAVGGDWGGSPGAYSVDKVSYDENGNIAALKRYGQVQDRLYALDDLTYGYEGNRLVSVDEQGDGQARLGFLDGASTSSEYGYDAGGNLTRDDNKGIESISYDPVLNLPLEVRMQSGTIRYSYDASGSKLSQVVEDGNGTLVSKTDYLGPFEYRNSELSLLHHAEGRVSFADGEDGNYHFDLKDHLGNIRVTFSDKPVSQTAMASMEASQAQSEEALFSGIAETRQTLLFHNTTEASIQEPEPQQVAMLLPGQQGPSKSVQVHAGDTISLRVQARYETAPASSPGLEGVATEIAGALEKTASGLESSGAATNITGAGLTGALLSGEEGAVPEAYLNYLLYDEDYQLIDQGFVKVSEAAAVGKNNPEAEAETLALEVPIAQDGFLYTYLSYEGGGGSSSAAASSAPSVGLAANSGLPANGPAVSNGVPVYFDDFTVEQLSYIVAVNDLYPFGASHDQERSVELNNKYRYQGKELVADLGLNLYDFHARQYDPLLGRFVQVDPAAMAFASMSPYASMGNNPITIIDPDGEWIHIVVGAVIGGAINLGIKAYQGKINSFGDGLAAFGIGAAAGAVGAATGGAAFLAAGGGAAGAGGFLAGFAGGAVGSAFGSPIQSFGNTLYFGDPVMGLGEYLLGIAGGGLLGGTVNGAIAAFNGRGFFTGNVLPSPSPANVSTPGVTPLEKPKALKLSSEVPEPTIKPLPDARQQVYSELLDGDEVISSVDDFAGQRLLTQGRFPKLDGHYTKHVMNRGEWGGVMSKNAYYDRALRLANSPVGGKIMGFNSKQGWTFRFNSRTGEFLTMKPNGIIETLFRPNNGIEYYLKQVQLYGQ